MTRVYSNSSFAVSTGIRFTTLSDTPALSSQTPSSSSSQPPTTITALFNPMMGHVSTAYAAKVSRDLSLCSRFDFNVYSYDSEWTVGAEWWMRRALSQPLSDSDTVQPPDNDPSYPQQGLPHSRSDIRGVVKTRISTNNVCWASSLFFILYTQLSRRLSHCYGKDASSKCWSVWVLFRTWQAGRNPSQPSDLNCRISAQDKAFRHIHLHVNQRRIKI